MESATHAEHPPVLDPTLPGANGTAADAVDEELTPFASAPLEVVRERVQIYEERAGIAPVFNTPAPGRPIGYRGRFEYVRVASLHADRNYQRNINPERVVELAQTFNPHAIGIIICSERTLRSNVHTGRKALRRIYVIDGQHRVEALITMGARDALVPCFIYEGLTMTQEAEIFVLLNKNRLPLKPSDVFRGRLAAGDPLARVIQDLLDEFGVRVKTWSGSPGRREVTAMGTLDWLIREGGADAIRTCFRVLLGAWGERPGSLQANHLRGIWLFHRATGGGYDEKRLTKKLAATSTDDLRDRVNALMTSYHVTRPTGIARLCQILYTEGLRTTQLPWHETEPEPEPEPAAPASPEERKRLQTLERRANKRAAAQRRDQEPAAARPFEQALGLSH